jgi:hypothetical protein
MTETVTLTEIITPLESLREQLCAFRAARRVYRSEDRLHPYACNEDLILRRGRVFEPSGDRPPITPIPRACFDQSYRLTQRRNSPWIYCEGFAINRTGLAVNHAWVIHPDAPNQAVELAWGDELARDCAYLGLPFQRKFVREMHLKSKRQYYSVLDAWWGRYPLLTGEIKLDDVIWSPDAEARQLT